MKISLPQITIHRQPLSNLEEALRLEWIVTNSLGGYASSTVLGINTRKYHGVLVASFNPPVDRRVVLSKLDEQLLVGDEIYHLGANEFSHGIHPKGYEYLESFSRFPFPTFIYSMRKAKLRKTILMPSEKNATVVCFDVESPSKTTLRVSPLVNLRHFHAVTDKDAIDQSFFQSTNSEKTKLTMQPDSTLIMSSTHGRYIAEGKTWIERMLFRTDKSQGNSYFDDCYIPGHFENEIERDAKSRFCIIATADKNEEDAENVHSSVIEELRDFNSFYQKELDRLHAPVRELYNQHPHIIREDWLKWLVLAADSFIVNRTSTNTKTVIAGYHWFEDWGRDALISLPGLSLVLGRFHVAREILLTFKHYMHKGIIPNRFPDKAGEDPVYNTVDATLWFFNAVLQYLKYTGDFDFIEKTLWKTLQSVITYHVQGTINNIHLDDDGLIVHAPQLTWMDAVIDNNPVTPREGKAVEIQALWYNSLKTMELIATHLRRDDLVEKYKKIADKAAKSFREKFWNPNLNCLLDARYGEIEDPSLRPNQILAVSLDFSMLDRIRQTAIVSIVQDKLWSPYGLKTLSQNDSKYRGKYCGNWAERNYAYHNGTTWPWLIGPFVTALLKTKNFDAQWRKYAFNNFLQPLFKNQVEQAGLGTISEIMDGDPPHSPGGCISQAWSVAEPLRAFVEDVLLERPPFENDVLRKISASKPNKWER